MDGFDISDELDTVSGGAVTADLQGAQPASTAEGVTLGGRYRLERLLGVGGMGAVWRASDALLQRSVAVKLVAVDGELPRARFGREARLASSVDHPGIVRVYDVGDREAVCYLVMELLTGTTLAAAIVRDQPTLSRTLAIAGDVAETMSFAHGRGLVHRDLKPDNIFLHGDAMNPRTVIIDFGLAFALEGDADVGRLTHGDVIAGTPAYMSPEQTRAGPLGPPSDVYALGCILFELLAGAPPFDGPAAVLLSQHAFAAPRRLREVWSEAPIALDDLIDTMLAKAPDGRPSMASVAATCRGLGAKLITTDDGVQTLRDRSAVAMSPRSARAISRVAAPEIETAPTAWVLVLGALPDDVLLALAACGLSAVRDRIDALPGCDAILAAVAPGELAALVARGVPVVTLHDRSLAPVIELIRLGVADAVPSNADPATIARKVARAARWHREFKATGGV
jgi:hypothetical protein